MSRLRLRLVIVLDDLAELTGSETLYRWATKLLEGGR